ncbi:MAG: hypothetical protein OEX02_17430, partial [Cyclobacteriaceae bacterium]|nr:hypothetical protein [Cyclobacteriaceae bacterium]
RYYIRESEVSSDVSIHILLDGSASMGFAYDRWNKFDYCKVITLLLTYMALRQGDEVTIHILKDSALQAFEIRSISRFPHLVNGLIGLKPGGQGGAKFVPQKCYNKTKKMCFLISDFYQDNKQEVDRLVDQLTVLSSETIAFHALSSAEEKLDYNGEVIFKDLETGAAVHTNPHRIRQEYMSRYAAFIRETREKMLKKGVYYHSLYMEQHVLETLELFLKYRDKMK